MFMKERVYAFIGYEALSCNLTLVINPANDKVLVLVALKLQRFTTCMAYNCNYVLIAGFIANMNIGLTKPTSVQSNQAK